MAASLAYSRSDVEEAFSSVFDHSLYTSHHLQTGHSIIIDLFDRYFVEQIILISNLEPTSYCKSKHWFLNSVMAW